MAPGPEHGSLTLEGNTLSADCRNLGWDDRPVFSAALKEFMKSEHPKLVLDLGRVEYLSSSYLGPISVALAEAEKSRREITILVQKRTACMLQTAGLDGYADIQVV